MHKFKYITYVEAVNEALDLSLKDPNLLCYGLGVSDPKEVFNTTKNLQRNIHLKEFLIFLALKMHLLALQLVVQLKNVEL